VEEHNCPPDQSNGGRGHRSIGAALVSEGYVAGTAFEETCRVAGSVPGVGDRRAAPPVVLLAGALAAEGLSFVLVGSAGSWLRGAARRSRSAMWTWRLRRSRPT